MQMLRRQEISEEDASQERGENEIEPNDVCSYFYVMTTTHEAKQLDSVIWKVLTIVNVIDEAGKPGEILTVKNIRDKFIDIGATMSLSHTFIIKLRSKVIELETFLACILCIWNPSERRLRLCLTILLWNLEMSVSSHRIHLGIIAP